MKGQSNRYLPKSSWCFSIFSSPGSSSVILAWALDWTGQPWQTHYFFSPFCGLPPKKYHPKKSIDISSENHRFFRTNVPFLYTKKSQKNPCWDGKFHSVPTGGGLPSCWASWFVVPLAIWCHARREFVRNGKKTAFRKKPGGMKFDLKWILAWKRWFISWNIETTGVEINEHKSPKESI